MSTLGRKTNLQKLKEQEESRGSFKFWKPQKDGKYIIRLLPNPSNDSSYYKGAFQHKIGENYFFCPRTEGQPCPICEKYNKLWKEGTESAIALARSIKPKEQYLYNIIVRQELDKVSEDPTKVYVYMAGKKLHGLLKNYFWDEEYGDLTDVDAGYDIQLVKELDPAGSGFPSYMNSKPKKNPSKLFDDEQLIEKVLRACRNLDKEVDISTYDELKTALNNFLSTEYDGGTAFVDNKVKTEPSTTEEKAPSSQQAADDFEKDLIASLKDDED